MQRMLSLLNLVGDDGRLNYIHLVCILLSVVFVLRNDLVGDLIFLACPALLSLELWLSPKPIKKQDASEIQSCKLEIERLAKDLRGFKIKLGFQS